MALKQGADAMSMRRREWLQALGCAGTAALAGVRGLAFGAEAAASGGTLVAVFLRGGADGLHMAAPVDDPDYADVRAQPLRVMDGGTASGLRLPHAFAPERDCRLHPAAAPLLELFQSGHAQLLHACGLSDATRSHFVAQEALESGVPLSGQRGSASSAGWLAPLLPAAAAADAVPCVATTAGRARGLQGTDAALNLVGDLGDALAWPGGAQGHTALQALYAGASDGDPAARLGRHALRQLELLDARLPRDNGRVQPYAPPRGVEYGTADKRWTSSLQTVAQLVRMDVGLKVACVDLGGWDTHEGQAGRMETLVRNWAQGLRALFDDVSAAGKPVTVLAMSEFGRRVRANASGGTDHGHGGVLWCLDTRGRTLLPPTRWPGLAAEQLDRGVDLQATQDVKAVLQAVGRQALAASGPA
jgi:uncharacterized protein (DUF1501 family)